MSSVDKAGRLGGKCDSDTQTITLRFWFVAEQLCARSLRNHVAMVRGKKLVSQNNFIKE